MRPATLALAAGLVLAPITVLAQVKALAGVPGYDTPYETLLFTDDGRTTVDSRH
ncbi:hypothetical protein [Rhodospira trueperi]|uniref:Uncharacterized protein n=1 Tax=Rhodospira trueperi TaxID=69960 RepID=A0A1G7CR92_9PROT|nr:hypothetical protein [Rhodospira trueperi]SDE41809.1 hypothetical protein SAMN05421720_106187 [Rhodospira trueperi]